MRLFGCFVYKIERILKIVGSSQEYFSPKLLVLLDCDVLRPMEEGEGEDGNGGHGGRVTSIFMMTLSCHFSFHDKALLSGRTCWALAPAWAVHLVFDQIGQDYSWGLTPLFPYSVYEARAWGVLDDGSDLLVWPSALLLNVVALPAGKWGGVGAFSGISGRRREQ